MQRTKVALFSFWALALGGTLAIGCGDDDGGDSTDDDMAAGEGGTRAGAGGGGRTGGTGGTKATAGSSGAPRGGSAGMGGSAGSDAGSGGFEQGGSGGSAGGPAAPVTKVNDVLIPGVHDLRGLTYSKSGKIYGSGHIGVDAKSVDRELAVVRFEADGTLDTSFGNGGIVAFNLVEREVDVIPGSSGGEGGAGGTGGAGGEGGATPDVEVVVNDGDEQSIGIVELADGDLIVQANLRDASGKGTDVALLRLDDEGDLVTSFGDDGIQRIDLGWTDADTWAGTSGPNDQAWGISLDATDPSEEKIVVHAFGPAPAGQMSGNPATQRTDNDRYVARVLASDGSLDPDFNDGEVFFLNTGGTFSDGARRGIVEEDGSILSSGYTNYGEGLGNHVVLIRLTPDGALDTDFGFGIATPGVLRSNPFLSDGGIAECYQVGKQSNGRYVTVGYGRATIANGTSEFHWATTDAVDLVSFGFQPQELDTSFGRQGTLAIQSEEAGLGNTEDRGRDLVVLPDDRIVFVGRFGPHPGIFVTTPDGELDADSGEDGKFLYDPLSDEGTSHFYRVALSADGTRVAATTNNHANGVLIAVLDVSAE